MRKREAVSKGEKQTNGSCRCADAFVTHDGYCFLTRVSFVSVSLGQRMSAPNLNPFPPFHSMCILVFPTFAALQLPISFVYLLSTLLSRIYSSLFLTNGNTLVLSSYDSTRRNFLSFLKFLFTSSLFCSI